MMKNLLFSIALAFIAITASAQPLVRPGMPLTTEKGIANIETVSPSAAALQSIEASGKGAWINITDMVMKDMQKNISATRTGQTYEQEGWWAYTTAGYCDALGFQNITYPATFNCATVLPALFNGAVIDSVAIFITDKTLVKDVKLWVGNNFYDKTPFDGSIQDVTSYNDFSDGADAATNIKLNTPYTVTSEGCVIGYTFTATGTSDTNPGYFVPVWCDEEYNKEESQPYGLILKIDQKGQEGTWANYDNSGLSNLAIMAYIKVPEVPLAVQPLAVTERTIMQGDEAAMTVLVKNDCNKVINNISYVVSVEGEPMEEQTATFTTPISARNQGYFFFSVPTEELYDYVSVEVEITKVNGETNNATTTTAEGGIIVLEDEVSRISLVEHFTGMWSGECPRGFVGAKRMKNDLGKGVVVLDVHFGDTLGCETYNNVVAAWTGGYAPIMAVDRNNSGDPYYGLEEEEFGATQLVQLCQNTFPAEATIAISAAWTDDTKTAINVSTETKFMYSRPGADDDTYAIAFVLSENGMSGEGDKWLQQNSNYAKNFLPEDLAFLSTAGTYNAADRVAYMEQVYDNVVVEAWSPYAGIAGSVKRIMYGNTLTYSNVLDISANKIIQNKDNLYLTAMLINRKNGSIANVDQINLSTGETGITGVTSENGAQEVARYNVNGVKLSAPQKGLNIIKLSNGQTVKTIVK